MFAGVPEDTLAIMKLLWSLVPHCPTEEERVKGGVAFSRLEIDQEAAIVL